MLYHLSFWYPTEKLPLRIGFFYACGMFSGTVSGLLAYAISFMDGAAGLAGWRWVRTDRFSAKINVDNFQLFILEGIPAIMCGVYTWFYLPNYPETVKFLTESEREAILSDLPKQAPTMKANTFSLEQAKSLFRDPTFIPFLFIWITHGIGGWGISFVLPTVIYELGIADTAISQVMTMVSNTRRLRPTLLTLPAPFYSRLRHPVDSSIPRPHSPSESLGCRPWRRSNADHLLHSLDHRQECRRKVHLRNDCNCSFAIFLRLDLA